VSAHCDSAHCRTCGRAQAIERLAALERREPVDMYRVVLDTGIQVLQQRGHRNRSNRRVPLRLVSGGVQ
jgi:hypothetical protein